MLDNYSLAYLVINRLYNSHVLNRIDTFEDVAKSLFGIQAQIANASAIAYSIRVNNPQYASYLEAFQDLKLIQLWGIRTTLHSYCFADWSIVLSQISTTENWFLKKMKKQGVDVEDLIKQAINIINDADCFDRDYLIKGGISEEYLGPWGDLLIELNNRGYICHTVNDGLKRKTFKNVKKYFDDCKSRVPQINDRIKREIVIRYFRAYGPATLHDFAHWLGCSVGQASGYVDIVKEELCEVICAAQCYYAPKKEYERYESVYYKFRRSNQCWLLPKFDPLLLAYNDKKWIVEEKYQKNIWKIAGHVEGVVVQNWKAIATWKYILKGSAMDFNIVLFESNWPINKNSLYKRCAEIAKFRTCRMGTIIIIYNGGRANETININN